MTLAATWSRVDVAERPGDIPRRVWGHLAPGRVFAVACVHETWLLIYTPCHAVIATLPGRTEALRCLEICDRAWRGDWRAGRWAACVGVDLWFLESGDEGEGDVVYALATGFGEDLRPESVGVREALALAEREWRRLEIEAVLCR